tara:strand:+ start:270 stop:1280 length:1011 start_codon:yes stop_codon:yes gene_type:complete
MKLLENLINDEKNIDKNLYSAGPYWHDRAKRCVSAVKKNGLSDFRSLDSNIGIGYADSVNIDARKNYGLFYEKFYSFLINIYPLSKIFEFQLNKTKLFHKYFLQYKEKHFQNNSRVNYLINKFNLEDTCNFGCVDCFNLNNKEFSFYYTVILDNHDYLSEYIDFTKIKNMFEIGGGFGQYIHILLQNYSNIKKILYLDIVPNIYIGTQYLKSFYGESVIDYNITNKLNKIQFANNDKLEIICIAPWQIEKVECLVDYFHNSHSFIEMSKKILLNYFKYIDKFMSKKCRISIVTYVKDTPAHLDIISILDKYFPKKLKSYQKNGLMLEGRKNYFFIG